MKTIYKTLLAAVLVGIAACSDTVEQPVADNSDEPITLTAEIEQVATSRVNDSGFCDGDVMGVYIVDYEGENPGTLRSRGNRGDNVYHTFNEAAYSWTSEYDVYWRDHHTKIDVYGYYPAASPKDVNAYTFEVGLDQGAEAADGQMGGYEASDFLWGKAEGIAPTSSRIMLPMRHRMANARVTLVEGDGFAPGEWAETPKQVLVSNTSRHAIIDLATGLVTASGAPQAKSIIPSRSGDQWRAIVVPQTVEAGKQLFSLTIGGLPYKFSKDEDFAYVGGKMSNFNIRVDKKGASGSYTLTLVGESITAWESDLTSHDAATRQYFMVNVAEPGTLEAAIRALSKDPAQVKSLKITGRIDKRDFETMNKAMTSLRDVNLKEARIMAWEGEAADEIPTQAFAENGRLNSIIFPDTLKGIGGGAFLRASGLTGSLVIPEGWRELNGLALLHAHPCRARFLFHRH